MAVRSTSLSGIGPFVFAGRELARVLTAVTRIGRSSKEFQASHCGQRPSQRGDSKPHAEQK